MNNSILTSTKLKLDIPQGADNFDDVIIDHINSVFGTLNELGIGPINGFAIEDDTADWDTFLGENLKYVGIKTYMFLRVRILFDPPETSFHVNAIKEQIKEWEWRLSTIREHTEWVDPNPTTDLVAIENYGGSVLFVYNEGM